MRNYNCSYIIIVLHKSKVACDPPTKGLTYQR